MPSPPPLSASLRTLLRRYCDHLRYDLQLGDATIAGARRTLTRFWRCAGVRVAGRVTREHYHAFLHATPDRANGQSTGRDYKPNTRVQYAARLLAAYRWFAAEGLLGGDGRNPLRRCKAPTPAPPVSRDAPVDKIVRLANTLADTITADPRLLVAVLLCYLAGLRRAEVTGARVEDLELDTDEPVLVVLGKGVGGGKERVVPIHPLLVGPLRQLVAGRAVGPLLANKYWPNRHVTPGYLGNLFRDAARAAGLAGLTPHMLRWSAARHLMDNGATEREVADFLGHASLAMTRRYTMGHRSRLHRTVVRLPVVCASKPGGHRVAVRPPVKVPGVPAVPPPKREPGVRCRGKTSRKRR